MAILSDLLFVGKCVAKDHASGAYSILRTPDTVIFKGSDSVPGELTG